VVEESQPRGSETPVITETGSDPVVELVDDDSPRIGGDPGHIGDDLDETLIQEIESGLAGELSEGEGAKRYRGQKVELDKADLELELDVPPEPEPEEEPPPVISAPAPAPEPEVRPAPWWTRWPVLVAAGVAAAVVGGGIIYVMRKPAPIDSNARTVWRGKITGHESLQLALEPFFVPVKGTPARRLKVVLVIVLSDFRTRDHFRRLSPSLIACRNAVYQILIRKSIEELTLNREDLQKQIRTRLNQILSSGKVTQVHFTEFLLTRVPGNAHA
jgi:flagellar basal body-associated protein FliL